jgi:DNA polymerase-1
MRETLHLVDASGYLFRSYYALPPMTRSDGVAVQGVYGFVGMLTRLLAREDIGRLGVVFDSKGPGFRRDLYEHYKAHRPPPPPDLVPQFGLVREATQAYGLPLLEEEGFEADDVIATYARLGREAGYHVVIDSSDKDMMQLVSSDVEMFDPLKNRVIDEAEVEVLYGVPPSLMVDLQALTGDSSDNIPGVPGIGVKTASLLLRTYGSLEGVLAGAEGIAQPKRRQQLMEHAEDARLSYRLAKLRDDVAVSVPLEALVFQGRDTSGVEDFLLRQNFRRFLKGSGSGKKASYGESKKGLFVSDVEDKSEALLREDSVERCYDLVVEESELLKWVEKARKAGVVAIDTETTSLSTESFMTGEGELVGVSLSVGAGEACYIPVGHRGADVKVEDAKVEDAGEGEGEGEGEEDAGKRGVGDLFGYSERQSEEKKAEQKAEQKAEDKETAGLGEEEDGKRYRQLPWSRVKEILSPLWVDASVLKVGHNLKYDIHVLEAYGCRVTPRADTLLMSFVLDAGREGSGGHRLEGLAKRHLGLEMVSFEDVVGRGRQKKTFADVLLAEARDYAAEDADMTLRLYEVLKGRLERSSHQGLYHGVEMGLIDVLVRMERWGVRVEGDVLKDLGRKLRGYEEVLEGDMSHLAGESFLPGSPKQVRHILFDVLGLSSGVKTKKGEKTTRVDVLEDLAEEGHEIARLLLKWRGFNKLRSTYAESLPKEMSIRDGRVHTTYAMTGARTGRLSSQSPNLQNIPIRTEEGREIRRSFVPEEGMIFLALDYNQIELRLLASLAGEETMRRAFSEGVDIHALTASRVFGVEVEEVDGEKRRQAKAINFGIVYGMSAYGLSRQLSIGVGEAKEFIGSYFSEFEALHAYKEDLLEAAKKNGYVETVLGRRLYVEALNSKNGTLRAHAERQALNAPIQGSAADIIKRAMIRIDKMLQEEQKVSRMVLQVHDEIVLEVPEGEADEMEERVKGIMEGAGEPFCGLSVPLRVDSGRGLNWEEAH